MSALSNYGTIFKTLASHDNDANVALYWISLVHTLHDMVKENAKPKKGEMAEDHKADLTLVITGSEFKTGWDIMKCWVAC